MGRRPYHGTVKGEPENETKIIEAAVMKEWIKKGKEAAERNEDSNCRQDPDRELYK